MARFNANLYNQKKSLLIVAVPVLALFMSILFVGSRSEHYAEHFVLSVQVYAFLLSFLAVAAAMFLLLMLVLRRNWTGHRTDRAKCGG